MRRYHTPAEALQAARAPHTDTNELERLAGSVYAFVRLAVAEHPATSAETLLRLVPESISTYHEQHLAIALARHPATPAAALAHLAERLPPLNRGRNRAPAVAAGLGLCSNHQTPFPALAALLSPTSTSSAIRRRVARTTTRPDVLTLLLNDRSERVRQQARARRCDTPCRANDVG